MHIYCFNPVGYEGGLVRVEVDIRRGLPAIDIVGLAGASVKEARDRIRVALRNCGFEVPAGHILVNLAPAGVPKTGAFFDLPIALAILVAGGKLAYPEEPVLVMGELTLDGTVCRVDAALPAIIEARRAGVGRVLLPTANHAEIQVLPAVLVTYLAHLKDAAGLNHKWTLTGPTDNRTEQDISIRRSTINERDEDFSDFDYAAFDANPRLGIGLLAAAAGRHHLLLYGPPGSGKTMALRQLGGLFPQLNEQEILEVNRLYSLAGLLSPESGILTRAPVRMPHHSATAEALVGGGKTCRPGEISLAHAGVLLLDEVSEFKPSHLQALREPLEEGRIRLSRADQTVWYPARFTMALSMNCCPCGRLGSSSGMCTCSSPEVLRYWTRLGGPLIDRIDIRLSIGMPDYANVEEEHETNLANYWDRIVGSGVSWLKRGLEAVAQARKKQRQRFGAAKGFVPSNGSLRGLRAEGLLLGHGTAKSFLDAYVSRHRLTARGRHAVTRLARTLGDLRGDDGLYEEDIKVAAMLRGRITPLPGLEIQQ